MWCGHTLDWKSGGAVAGLSYLRHCQYNPKQKQLDDIGDVAICLALIRIVRV